MRNVGRINLFLILFLNCSSGTLFAEANPQPHEEASREKAEKKEEVPLRAEFPKMSCWEKPTDDPRYFNTGNAANRALLVQVGEAQASLKKQREDSLKKFLESADPFRPGRDEMESVKDVFLKAFREKKFDERTLLDFSWLTAQLLGAVPDDNEAEYKKLWITKKGIDKAVKELVLSKEFKYPLLDLANSNFYWPGMEMNPALASTYVKKRWPNGNMKQDLDAGRASLLDAHFLQEHLLNELENRSLAPLLKKKIEALKDWNPAAQPRALFEESQTLCANAVNDKTLFGDLHRITQYAATLTGSGLPAQVRMTLAKLSPKDRRWLIEILEGASKGELGEARMGRAKNEKKSKEQLAKEDRERILNVLESPTSENIAWLMKQNSHGWWDKRASAVLKSMNSPPPKDPKFHEWLMEQLKGVKQDPESLAYARKKFKDPLTFDALLYSALKENPSTSETAEQYVTSQDLSVLDPVMHEIENWNDNKDVPFLRRVNSLIHSMVTRVPPENRSEANALVAELVQLEKQLQPKIRALQEASSRAALLGLDVAHLTKLRDFLKKLVSNRPTEEMVNRIEGLLSSPAPEMIDWELDDNPKFVLSRDPNVNADLSRAAYLLIRRQLDPSENYFRLAEMLPPHHKKQYKDISELQKEYGAFLKDFTGEDLSHVPNSRVESLNPLVNTLLRALAQKALAMENLGESDWSKYPHPKQLDTSDAVTAILERRLNSDEDKRIARDFAERRLREINLNLPHYYGELVNTMRDPKNKETREHLRELIDRLTQERNKISGLLYGSAAAIGSGIAPSLDHAPTSPHPHLFDPANSESILHAALWQSALSSDDTDATRARQKIEDTIGKVHDAPLNELVSLKHLLEDAEPNHEAELQQKYERDRNEAYASMIQEESRPYARIKGFLDGLEWRRELDYDVNTRRPLWQWSTEDIVALALWKGGDGFFTSILAGRNDRLATIFKGREITDALKDPAVRKALKDYLLKDSDFPLKDIFQDPKQFIRDPKKFADFKAYILNDFNKGAGFKAKLLSELLRDYTERLSTAYPENPAPGSFEADAKRRADSYVSGDKTKLDAYRALKGSMSDPKNKELLDKLKAQVATGLEDKTKGADQKYKAVLGHALTDLSRQGFLYRSDRPPKKLGERAESLLRGNLYMQIANLKTSERLDLLATVKEKLGKASLESLNPFEQLLLESLEDSLRLPENLFREKADALHYLSEMADLWKMYPAGHTQTELQESLKRAQETVERINGYRSDKLKEEFATGHLRNLDHPSTIGDYSAGAVEPLAHLRFRGNPTEIFKQKTGNPIEIKDKDTEKAYRQAVTDGTTDREAALNLPLVINDPGKRQELFQGFKDADPQESLIRANLLRGVDRGLLGALADEVNLHSLSAPVEEYERMAHEAQEILQTPDETRERIRNALVGSEVVTDLPLETVVRLSKLSSREKEAVLTIASRPPNAEAIRALLNPTRENIAEALRTQTAKKEQKPGNERKPEVKPPVKPTNAKTLLEQINTFKTVLSSTKDPKHLKQVQEFKSQIHAALENMAINPAKEDDPITFKSPDDAEALTLAFHMLDHWGEGSSGSRDTDPSSLVKQLRKVKKTCEPIEAEEQAVVEHFRKRLYGLGKSISISQEEKWCALPSVALEMAMELEKAIETLPGSAKDFANEKFNQFLQDPNFGVLQLLMEEYAPSLSRLVKGDEVDREMIQKAVRELVAIYDKSKNKPDLKTLELGPEGKEIAKALGVMRSNRLWFLLAKDSDVGQLSPQLLRQTANSQAIQAEKEIRFEAASEILKRLAKDKSGEDYEDKLRKAQEDLSKDHTFASLLRPLVPTSPGRELADKDVTDKMRERLFEHAYWLEDVGHTLVPFVDQKSNPANDIASQVGQGIGHFITNPRGAIHDWIEKVKDRKSWNGLAQTLTPHSLWDELEKLSDHVDYSSEKLAEDEQRVEMRRLALVGKLKEESDELQVMSARLSTLKRMLKDEPALAPETNKHMKEAQQEKLEDMRREIARLEPLVKEKNAHVEELGKRLQESMRRDAAYTSSEEARAEGQLRGQAGAIAAERQTKIQSIARNYLTKLSHERSESIKKGYGDRLKEVQAIKDQKVRERELAKLNKQRDDFEGRQKCFRDYYEAASQNRPANSSSCSNEDWRAEAEALWNEGLRSVNRLDQMRREATDIATTINDPALVDKVRNAHTEEEKDAALNAVLEAQGNHGFYDHWGHELEQSYGYKRREVRDLLLKQIAKTDAKTRATTDANCEAIVERIKKTGAQWNGSVFLFSNFDTELQSGTPEWNEFEKDLREAKKCSKTGTDPWLSFRSWVMQSYVGIPMWSKLQLNDHVMVKVESKAEGPGADPELHFTFKKIKTVQEEAQSLTDDILKKYKRIMELEKELDDSVRRFWSPITLNIRIGYSKMFHKDHPIYAKWAEIDRLMSEIMEESTGVNNKGKPFLAQYGATQIEIKGEDGKPSQKKSAMFAALDFVVQHQAMAINNPNLYRILEAERSAGNRTTAEMAATFLASWLIKAGLAVVCPEGAITYVVGKTAIDLGKWLKYAIVGGMNSANFMTTMQMTVGYGLEQGINYATGNHGTSFSWLSTEESFHSNLGVFVPSHILEGAAIMARTPVGLAKTLAFPTVSCLKELYDGKSWEECAKHGLRALGYTAPYWLVAKFTGGILPEGIDNMKWGPRIAAGTMMAVNSGIDIYQANQAAKKAFEEGKKRGLTDEQAQAEASKARLQMIGTSVGMNAIFGAMTVGQARHSLTLDLVRSISRNGTSFEQAARLAGGKTEMARMGMVLTVKEISDLAHSTDAEQQKYFELLAQRFGIPEARFKQYLSERVKELTRNPSSWLTMQNFPISDFLPDMKKRAQSEIIREFNDPHTSEARKQELVGEALGTGFHGKWVGAPLTQESATQTLKRYGPRALETFEPTQRQRYVEALDRDFVIKQVFEVEHNVVDGHYLRRDDALPWTTAFARAANMDPKDFVKALAAFRERNYNPDVRTLADLIKELKK